MRISLPLLLATSLCLSPVLSFAQDGEGKAAGASGTDTPENALKKLVVTPGLQVDLWAAEPLLENPVAFSFDHKGRAYIMETMRRRSSALDIRKHTDWLIEDLALRSVEERVAFLKKSMAVHSPKRIKDLNGDGRSDWHDMEVEKERIRLVEDTNGDGKADKAKIFAEGFGDVATVMGAGVLVHGEDVFMTCIPDLWRFRDSKNAGVADQQEKLLSGFGVHIAYGGHDMHGLKFGPDGKVYWTIADTGSHVKTKEGTEILQPDCGAVFRCNPDGTEMELVMRGLRNPQSLAFNDFGDLFTGDNNADGGDKARWVHVVEGGDAGWRMGWQFLPKLGGWNSEKLWELDNGALSQLQPVGHIGHGPAGIAYYPGTGLPESYAGHFFYADFPGGVRDFALVPKGASYTVENAKGILMDNSQKDMSGKLLWNLYPSDVQFGVDGGAYVLDWVYGWEKTGKGRIFRVHSPAVDQSAAVLETKKLLGEGMSARPDAELGKLLGHVDQRVRLEAQFELVKRGNAIALSRATTAGQPRLARIHGIWGMTQLARKNPEAARTLMPLFADADGEVRAQWAKFIGDAKVSAERELIVRLLKDGEPRVRFFAAMALSKIGIEKDASAIVEMLQTNTDGYVRHAAVMALTAIATPELLAKAAASPSDEIRGAALLVLRREESPAVAALLSDKNPLLALEAARAIHDTPIAAAFPPLAALASRTGLSTPFSRRAINAAYFLGTTESAQSLAKLAADSTGPEAQRLDALEALTQWNTALGRDRITGLFHPLPASRNASAAALAAAPIVPALLKNAPPAVRLAALEMTAELQMKEAAPALIETVADQTQAPAARVAALKALAAIQSPSLLKEIAVALEDKDSSVVAEAHRLEGIASPVKGLEQNAATLAKGKLSEKQTALQSIGASVVPEASALLGQWLDRLAEGKVPAALKLDLLEAAAKRNDPALTQKLAAYEASRATASDALAKWTECLEGGNAKAGREIFYEKAEAACMRCHKVAGEGGDVGPDLAGIGKKFDRAYILTSIVDPNAAIAQGYENVLVTTRDGNMVAGLLSSETPSELILKQLSDGASLKIPIASIKQRDKVPSPMPPGLAEVLGKHDLRDVVEFLATVK